MLLVQQYAAVLVPGSGLILCRAHLSRVQLVQRIPAAHLLVCQEVFVAVRSWRAQKKQVAATTS